MKTKLLLNVALLVTTLNIYSQDNMELSEKISNSYAENGSYVIYSPRDSEAFENLKFIEYVKLDKTKFDFAKILIPKIVILDTKQGDDVKKNQKRIEFLKKNTLENSIEGLELTKSKFDFNNSDVIILGNSEINNIDIKSNSYKFIRFKDNVIAKYQGEKSNNLYYIVDFGFYGIIEESEYNKSVSERVNAYKDALENITNIKTGELREESKKWLDGNFIKIFPEEKIYMYDVSYLYNGPVNVGGPTQISLNSFAISNISPKSISKEDFPTSKEINYVSYNYVKDFNVLKLIYKEKTPLDSIYKGGNNNRSSYSYWKKGESEDPILDLEKDAVLGGEKDISKYNNKYFLNKVKEKDLIRKEPLNLEFKKSKNEYNGYNTYNISLLHGIELGSFSKNEEINFSVNKPTSFYSEEIELFQPDINRKFDIRVDKPDFNFTYVDLGFIYPFLSNMRQDKMQSRKESLEEFLAKEYATEIIEFDKFVKETKVNDKQSDQIKQALINKFGAKYTNEALNGNIIVGMPEGLLPIPLRLWQISSRTKWKSGYRLYCTSMLNSASKLSVYVENGKVTMVSY